MARPRNKFVDYALYLCVRVFAMFVHMFGRDANYRTARALGNLFYRLDHRHRHRGMEHLRRSFPEWSEGRRRRICKASMRSLVYLGLEVLLTTRLITPGRWQRHISLSEMKDFIRLMTEQKTGVIVVTGHFGNWEVAGYAMATLGYPCYAIARPLDNPYINEYLLGVRQRRGMIVLDKIGAAGSIQDILAANGVVAFVADQDAGRKGMFVDFFGRPASTYKSIGLMAMQHEVPLAVAYGRRLDEGFRFELGCERIIRPHEWKDKDDPLRWITQEYTHALERVVRTAPEQYLWVHRRWKHRPKGEQRGPDGIA
jgi:KDO2-lipid IV(A) lauroyltransferase